MKIIQPTNKGNKETMRESAFSLLFLNKRVWKVLSILAIIILFLVPIYRLVLMSFSNDTGLTFTYYTEILSEKRTWRVLGNTAIVVGGSTIIAIVLGVLLAWVMAYTDIRHKKIMQLFLFLPFIIPSYITTLAWTQFLGANGLFVKMAKILPFHIDPWNIYSLSGIVFVMGFSHYPLVYLLTINVFKKIPRDMEQAARCAGASRGKSFIKVVLPLAFPGIAGGGFLAFLASLDNFGIPAFLGIPAQITVLSTYIYEQVIGFGPSAFARAAVLSAILGVIALIGITIQWLLLRRSKQIETTTNDPNPRYFLGKRRVFIECTLWVFFIITSIIPLISMGMTSLISAYGLDFTFANISWKNYQFILESSTKSKQAILNSLKLSTITTIFGMIVGTAFAYIRVRKNGRLLKITEVMMSVPYALPGTVLALAMIFAWMEPIPGWNPGIYGSMMILLIAYITRFLILQVRGSITAFLQVDITMEEAARVSGTNGFAKWRKILIPLILPGLLSGAMLVFLTALTELTVSSLLWSTGTETIGVVILSFEQAGYTTYSTAFSSLIVIMIILGFLGLYIIQSILNRKVEKLDDNSN